MTDDADDRSLSPAEMIRLLNKEGVTWRHPPPDSPIRRLPSPVKETEPPTPAELVEWLTRRPDWRDASAYPPAPGSLDSIQWYGIEFGRRHPDFADRALTWIEAADKKTRALFYSKGRFHWHYPQTFGIEVFGFVRVEMGPRIPSRSIMLEGVEWNAERAARDRVTLVFDLREPIDAQLLRAGDELRECQRYAIKAGHVQKPPGYKTQRNKLPMYLRMLDAEHAGEKPAEVARVLRCDRKDVARWTRAAHVFVDWERVSYLLSQAMPTRAK